MFQLQVLSGKAAGRHVPVRRFPFRVGRGADADLALDAPGLWAAHFSLELDRANACVRIVGQGDARVSVNGEATSTAELRNGDLIDAGGLRLRFGLGDVRQRSLGLREWSVWVGVGLLTALQLILIHWVLP